MNSFLISSCRVCFPTGACEIRHSSSELTRQLDAGPCEGALHSTEELQGGGGRLWEAFFFLFFRTSNIAYSIHNQVASYILFPSSFNVAAPAGRDPEVQSCWQVSCVRRPPVSDCALGSRRKRRRDDDPGINMIKYCRVRGN